jgi:hypothetical protein
MASTNTFARSLHDVGLATWFGGSLMGDIALNGAASTAAAPAERATITATGWARYSRWLGQRLIAKPGAPVDAATTPNESTPVAVADAQRKLRITQWTIPALTGAIVVLTAWMGEQQRPATVISGVLDRVIPGRST